MNLFLIGYRCTGKTTVGKSIADTIDWAFVDADIMLIEEYGKSIKDIIDTDGWESFRRMECSMLKQICAEDRQVVATGGGVVLDDGNIKAMKTSGLVVWLGATAATIHKRMLVDKKTGHLRPALTQKGTLAEIEDMLIQRSPYYQSACNFSVQTDDVPVEVIAQKIIRKLSVAPVTR